MPSHTVWIIWSMAWALVWLFVGFAFFPAWLLMLGSIGAAFLPIGETAADLKRLEGERE